MPFYVRLNNIETPKDFQVFYTSGRTPGGVFLPYNGGSVFPESTSEIVMDFTTIDPSPYGKQYWFKLQYTGDSGNVGYIIENVNIHDEIFYQSYINSETPTPTPTKSVTPTATVTPTITPTNTVTPTITPTNTVTPTVTPTPPNVSASPTPTTTPTITPTITDTPTNTPTPTITPTQTADIRTDTQVEVNTFVNNIRYEVTFSNSACIYSGICAGGNQLLYTGGNSFTGCFSGCTDDSTIKTSQGDIQIAWTKTRNDTGTCTSGPCLADDTTTVNIYINGSEAFSYGSPFNYDGPSGPGGAESVSGTVTLTGITITDTVKILITEG